MAKHSSKRAEGDADASPLDGVTFDLDDITFTCEGETSMFRMAEVIRQTRETVGAQGISMATAAESLRQVLGDTEYTRFTDHVFARNTDDSVIFAILDDINTQLEANIAAAAGRPTTPSSGSSPGEPDQGGQPARIINLGEPGGNLRTLDGDSPDELKAAAEATRAPAARPARKKPGRQAAAS